MAIWLLGIKTRGGIELATRSYPYGLFSIITATAGSVLIIQLGCELAKVEIFEKIFGFIGENTLLFLGIHCLDMQFCNWTFILESYSISIQLLIKGIIYFSLCIFFLIIKQQIQTYFLKNKMVKSN